MNASPSGWATATLSELFSENGIFSDGDWVESKDQDPTGEIRLIQLADVGDGTFRNRSNRFLNYDAAERLRCTILEKGDVLIARMPDPLGRACIFPGDSKNCATVVDVAIFRSGKDSVNNKLIANFINSPSFRSRIEELSSGTTRTRISRKNLGSIDFPLPPANEQKRILKKLEACEARIETAREALSDVPKLLEHYRQSILASAFRGDLTRNWRIKHPNAEAAEALLDRLRIERRQRWEQAELEKYESKGKAPPKGWKSKYKAPQPFTEAQLNELPDLPDGWCWAKLSECGELARGKSKHRPRNDPRLYGNEYPFIQTGQVANANGLITEAKQFYSEFGLKQSRLFPKGTLCITIAANIADTALLGIDACFPDSVVGLVSDNEYLSIRYIEFYIRTVRNHLEMVAPATAQKNINLTILNEVAVPIPSIDEMSQIELILSNVDKSIYELKSIHGKSHSDLAELTQSLLAKAFRGELVPQDPNDEPASKLLDRIAEARKTVITKPQKKTKRSTPKNKIMRKPLVEAFSEPDTELTPEELFQLSGFSLKEVEDFYAELKQAVQNGLIQESRDDTTDIKLSLASAS